MPILLTNLISDASIRTVNENARNCSFFFSFFFNELGCPCFVVRYGERSLFYRFSTSDFDH